MGYNGQFLAHQGIQRVLLPALGFKQINNPDFIKTAAKVTSRSVIIYMTLPSHFNMFWEILQYFRKTRLFKGLNIKYVEGTTMPGTRYI
jgi:hypothetical protein